MDTPLENDDDIKQKYLEKALHANDDAAKGATMSDLIDKNSIIYKAQHPEAEEQVKPVPVKKEVPQVDEDGYPNLSQIHTFKADLTDIVAKDQLSLSRIAMMQGKANIQIPENKEPHSLQNKIYITVAIMLLLLGIGIVGSIVVLYAPKTQVTTPQTQKEKYIIFAEATQDINVSKATKTEIRAILDTEIKKFREEDSIMEIIPYYVDDLGKHKAPIGMFFDKLSARAPESLRRTLADKFFFGFYSKKGRTDPFIIMYTSSYDTAYPALLEWEGYMQDDFDSIFTTKTKSLDGSIVPLSFKDRIILNKDARSFEDSEGRTAFFYTFLDPNTILFAKTSDTVLKVNDRLREAKFQ